MICPKCGVKIKPYDWRQNCKSCGTNLFLHDFDKRLLQDSIQAEIDYKWWIDMTDHFMNYGFRDKFALARFLVSVTPLTLIPAPIAVFNGKIVMMISFLLDILGGGKMFPEGFGVSDMSGYKGLAPAMLFIVISIVLAVFAFFATLIGPAFLKFKAPLRLYYLITPLATVGVIIFNFVFIPNYTAVSGVGVSGSFGLYIYLATVIANLILQLRFQKHAKNFT